MEVEGQEVAEQHAQDTENGYSRERTAWDVEVHAEAHGRDGGDDGSFPIGDVGHHAQFFEKVVDVADAHGKDDAEGHGGDLQYPIAEACKADVEIVVEHVVEEVDERNSWHEIQTATEERMIGIVGESRGQDEEEQPCGEGGHEGSECGDHVEIVSSLEHEIAHHIGHGSCDGGGDEGRPVATEEHGEAAAPERSAECDSPNRILGFHLSNLVESALKLLDAIVFADGSPRKLRHCRQHVHVDGVFVGVHESTEGMRVVAVVHFDGAVEHINVKVSVVETEEGGDALHVADDAVGVGSRLHEHHSCAEEDGEFAVEVLFVLLYGECVHSANSISGEESSSSTSPPHLCSVQSYEKARILSLSTEKNSVFVEST